MLTTTTKPLDLQTLRRKLGLTQMGMAQKLGTSVRTVRRWEAGAAMHLIWQDRLSQMFQARFPRTTVPRLVRR